MANHLPAPPASVLRARLMARVRLRHLQVLLRVAELGSLHKAAVDVGLTQPAVSQQLAELERLLEARLFVRLRSGVEPTALCRALLPVVRRLLRAVDEAAETTAAVGAHAAGVVRVVASGSAVASLLSQVLPMFTQNHPDVVVHVREAEPSQLASLVALGEADAVVCREPSTTLQGWRFTPLQDDRLMVVARAGHPLARKRLVSRLELASAEWLALPIDSNARAAFESLFAGAALPPQRQVTTRTPAILWAMVQAHPLLALVPASLARQFLDAGIFKEVSTGLRLPLLPIGMLLPLQESGAAAQRLAEALLRSFGAEQR